MSYEHPNDVERKFDRDILDGWKKATKGDKPRCGLCGIFVPKHYWLNIRLGKSFRPVYICVECRIGMVQLFGPHHSRKNLHGGYFEPERLADTDAIIADIRENYKSFSKHPSVTLSSKTKKGWQKR
jgi:hypothetical protein